MKSNRKVYIVIGYSFNTRSNYVSDAFTTRKKADAHCEFMARIMKEHAPEDERSYWVYDTRLL